MGDDVVISSWQLGLRFVLSKKSLSRCLTAGCICLLMYYKMGVFSPHALQPRCFGKIGWLLWSLILENGASAWSLCTQKAFNKDFVPFPQWVHPMCIPSVWWRISASPPFSNAHLLRQKQYQTVCFYIIIGLHGKNVIVTSRNHIISVRP